MSINMDSGGTEYADHEVQVITNQISFNGTSDTSSEQIEVLDQLDPVSNRGIDSDELAELVFMRRHAMLYIDAAANQSQVGELFAEHSFGINLGSTELPPNANNNNSTAAPRNVNEDNTNIDSSTAQSRGANYSEPGILDFGSLACMAGYENAATGGAGGGATNAMAKNTEINFSENFGSGPYIDRTDDLTVFAELNAENLVSDVSLETTYVLYWSVEEMPEGRASFARP